MDIPKVSIVIPVYNGKDYLSEAIDCALEQTYDNLEIIVVNDGSDDCGATERIALSYGEKIKYYRKENGGVASALNYAINKMTGEYFSWLSHDDLYVSYKVKSQIDMLRKYVNRKVVLYSDYAVFTSDKDASTPVFLKGVPEHGFRFWITIENKLHGCTLLIPRCAFDEVGMFNEDLRTTQDYDLWFRMAKEYSFIHMPMALVKARSHCDQGTCRMADIALHECNVLLSKFIQELDPREIVAATSAPLSESYSIIASSMYSRGFDTAGDLAEEYARKVGIGRSGLLSKIKKKTRYHRDRLSSVIRQTLPPRVKQKIKSIIGYNTRQCMPANNTMPSQLRQKFSEIYENNTFGGRVSRSGEGSDLVQTAIIRRELPRIIKEYSIKSFFDAPCGDWYWMKETELCVEKYVGADIVETIINNNKKHFSKTGYDFTCINLATDSIPKVDMIFSRDCHVHLSFSDALSIIENFKKSGSHYLLMTTFTDRSENTDLAGSTSFWRPLNMCRPPFNFPAPLLLVNEGCTEENGLYYDKCLGLWKLEDINIERYYNNK